MIVLSKITTKTGDKGSTGLGDGSRVSKSSWRVHAYGDVDELNSSLGLAMALIKQECERAQTHTLEPLDDVMGILKGVQNDLFDLGADVCRPISVNEREGQKQKKKAQAPLRIMDAYIDRLERQTEESNQTLEPLTSFILPGGSVMASGVHVARTVARRAERNLIRLMEKEPNAVNPLAMIYLNRLSDLLFVVARKLQALGGGDVLWEPGKNRL